MALLPSSQDKKQKYLIYVLGVAILGIVFMLWYRFYQKPQPPQILVPTPPQEIRINFGVLENPVLKESEPFKEIPPFEGIAGRENPFTPY
jgi:hypothetical protein